MPVSRISFNCASADDEEKHRYEGLKFNKTLTLSPRAELKIYKLEVVVDDDVVNTFSPDTPKCATPERADLSGERINLDEPSKDEYRQADT
ncbi:hypothetical protein FXO38_34563 [Capsicum annuum]|uniref:Uncharacterized protein n=1 Tax=Capsicum annuum TaxID=4072 RepID=A0A2G2YVQ9_CAPAN|nr:hypothetical protein FXO38_34563 [Capsicum annuum]KAF3650737.1 hypothetical protein FXO37_18326 [Capsicum annuum]PHT73832.1 hypothetical protein T459_21109 [Capsicum annuum]